MNNLTLISHDLCPYVQRAAISLKEKGVPFERVYVDLSNKPEWFKAISPLGKVPLLKISDGVSDEVIFESAVILEYLEETQANPLHSSNPLERARQRSWIEFGSAVLNGIARLYSAKTESAFEQEKLSLRQSFERLEQELADRKSGPYFDGDLFTLVDAVFGPVFRYFTVFENAAGVRILDGLSRINEWRQALSMRASIQDVVLPDYPERLRLFLKNKNSYISSLIA